MNRIYEKFRTLKRRGKKAFIAYICAGDPDLDTTKRLVLEFDKLGVDIIELGVPFSDPLADGPTIQRASQRALKNKINLPKIFSMVRSLRKNTQVPLVLMTYFNPVYHYGVEKFARDARQAGADGVIVPDLSCEESADLVRYGKRYGLATIFLIAPTSTGKRIRLIAQKSEGFIYYVSLTGVTGARKALPAHIREHIKKIRGITKKPVCIGFGVSDAAQIRLLSSFCDGVIVGSAIINIIEKNLTRRQKAVKEATSFVRYLMKGLR